MTSTACALACPCCGHEASAFLPFGRIPRTNAQCPDCGALERHRLLALLFDRRPSLLAGARTVLHVAPERPLTRRLARPGAVYVTCDLMAPGVSVRLDLTRLPFADRTFDAVLCNHVLEHVPDDRRAMAELRRVLRPSGWAILQSPVDSRLERTLEDPTVTDPAERERLFGQKDHVRQYGRDYAARLQDAGFALELIPFGVLADAMDTRRHALLPEHVHLCRSAA
ncbi:MAG TPA: class I SAM-dependent methyltransferase [Vicinamibacterales bacterium]